MTSALEGALRRLEVVREGYVVRNLRWQRDDGWPGELRDPPDLPSGRATGERVDAVRTLLTIALDGVEAGDKQTTSRSQPELSRDNDLEFYRFGQR